MRSSRTHASSASVSTSCSPELANVVPASDPHQLPTCTLLTPIYDGPRNLPRTPSSSVVNGCGRLASCDAKSHLKVTTNRARQNTRASSSNGIYRITTSTGQPPGPEAPGVYRCCQHGRRDGLPTDLLAGPARLALSCRQHIRQQSLNPRAPPQPGRVCLSVLRPHLFPFCLEFVCVESLPALVPSSGPYSFHRADTAPPTYLDLKTPALIPPQRLRRRSLSPRRCLKKHHRLTRWRASRLSWLTRSSATSRPMTSSPCRQPASSCTGVPQPTTYGARSSRRTFLAHD